MWLRIIRGIFFCFACGAVQAADNFPYEQCTWKNRIQTDKLVENFKDYLVGEESRRVAAESKPDCPTRGLGIEPFLEWAAQVKSRTLEYVWGKSEQNYSPLCFLASGWKGKRLWKPAPGGKSYYHCSKGKTRPLMLKEDDAGRRRKIYTRSFCMNGDYVQLIAKSFNEMSQCFDLTDDEKKYFFAIYSHESSFHLNKRSRTSARCLGQVTMVANIEVNRDINWGRTDIAAHVFKKCPRLKDEIIPEDILRRKLSKKKIKYLTLKSRGRFNCHLSHNPYACLFYSIYFLKYYEEILEKEMSKSMDHTDIEISEEHEEQYQLPIKMGEILHLKGTCNHRVKGAVEGSWLFDRDDEVYDFLQRCRFDKSIVARKVDLFENFYSKVKLDVLLTSYNGGSSILNDYFPSFIKYFKRKIVRKCDNDSKCPHRRIIESGNSLSPHIFYDNFGKFLMANYSGKIRRRKEVANFSFKVSNDLQDVGMGTDEARKTLVRYLKSHFGDNVSQRQIDDFVIHLGQVCPGRLHRGTMGR